MRMRATSESATFRSSGGQEPDGGGPGVAPASWVRAVYGYGCLYPDLMVVSAPGGSSLSSMGMVAFRAPLAAALFVARFGAA